jgi:hypothetical protein
MKTAVFWDVAPCSLVAVYFAVTKRASERTGHGSSRYRNRGIPRLVREIISSNFRVHISCVEEN